MPAITLEPPWLDVRFDRPQRALSWSLNRPGFQIATHITWLHVQAGDLTPAIDARAFLDDRLAATGRTGAIALMTARNVAKHHVATAICDGLTAAAIATVGLANAGRVGAAVPNHAVGTINLLLHVSTALTDAAFVELVSVAAEARTAAVLDCGLVRDGRRLTGTGTDCIVIAAPLEGAAHAQAGHHTALGQAAGRAALEAVQAGATAWCDEQGEAGLAALNLTRSISISRSPDLT